MNRKKLVSLCLVLALLVTAAVGATFAYFTDTDNATNEFTVGNVKIDLTEPAWAADDGTPAQGKIDAAEVYPGEALAKNPQVKNIGENPCLVRVSVSNLNQFGEKGWIEYRTKGSVGVLGENWEYFEGYYYYMSPLAKDASTTELFDHIVMPTGLTGDETTLPIEVVAQAVQAQGAMPSFSAVDSMTAAQMADWFAKCGF